MDNKIATQAIVKPIVCVYFLDTKLTKLGNRLMDFKRRISEMEEVVVTYSFYTTWVRSATFMNTKIAWDTKIGHITFFATEVASELH